MLSRLQFKNRLTKLQTTSDTPAEPKLDARFTYTVQNERVEGIVRLILTIFIVGLMMLPTVVLFVLPSHDSQDSPGHTIHATFLRSIEHLH